MRLLLWLLPFSLFVTLAFAHIPDRPDLNKWAMGLRNGGGIPCCDNSEATPVMDADWKVDSNGHYRVYLEGEWVEVPDTAVVQVPNRYGRTLVWYAKYTSIMIRCFLPAAGV